MKMITFPILLAVLLSFPALISAQSGYIEVTATGKLQLKLAVDSPRSQDLLLNVEAAKEMGNVIAFDMNMAGNVTADAKEQSPLPGLIEFAETDFSPWSAAGYDLLVSSEFSIKGDDLTVEFCLFDVLNRKMMIAKRYLGKTKDLRHFPHLFSDEILLALTPH